MEGIIEIDGVAHAFRLEGRRGRSVEFSLGGKNYTVEALDADGERVRIRVNGTPWDVALDGDGGALTAKPGERCYAVKAPFLPHLEKWLGGARGPSAKKAASSPASGGEGAVTAPMPGKILAVFVEPGKAVKKGEALLTLEAMKMENQIQAPLDGTVEAVHVEAGADVAKGAVLVEIRGG